MLVRRHGPMVLRVCRNALLDPNDAQDAFQATFLVLVRRSRVAPGAGFARGLALRRRLPGGGAGAGRGGPAAGHRGAGRPPGCRRPSSRPTPNDIDRDEFGPIVQEEVRRLPERYRAVVVLCYWEGLTQEQAAAQLGCPLGTVRSRLARARDLLRRRLTRPRSRVPGHRGGIRSAGSRPSHPSWCSPRSSGGAGRGRTGVDPGRLGCGRLAGPWDALEDDHDQARRRRGGGDPGGAGRYRRGLAAQQAGTRADAGAGVDVAGRPEDRPTRGSQQAATKSGGNPPRVANRARPGEPRLDPVDDPGLGRPSSRSLPTERSSRRAISSASWIRAPSMLSLSIEFRVTIKTAEAAFTECQAEPRGGRDRRSASTSRGDTRRSSWMPKETSSSPRPSWSWPTRSSRSQGHRQEPRPDQTSRAGPAPRPIRAREGAESEECPGQVHHGGEEEGAGSGRQRAQADELAKQHRAGSTRPRGRRASTIARSSSPRSTAGSDIARNRAARSIRGAPGELPSRQFFRIDPGPGSSPPDPKDDSADQARWTPPPILSRNVRSSTSVRAPRPLRSSCGPGRSLPTALDSPFDRLSRSSADFPQNQG